MAALLSLQNYSDSNESDSDADCEKDGFNAHLKPLDKPRISTSSMALVAAPDVVSNEDTSGLRHIDPKTKELKYNPKHDELFAPTIGPINPFKTQQAQAVRNTLSGYAEPAHFSRFQFDNQRQTFSSYGFALDPTADGSGATEKYIGDETALDEAKGKTVFEKNNAMEKAKKRKREKNRDASDIDGYLGPWAKYKDEETISKPSEEEQKELDEILAKRAKAGKQVEEKTVEEKSTLHSKSSCI
ncbi:pre-mRNA-processing factor 17-like [Elysia marginata]|uniref:Pre-mRNA-processing factor 17-like n=1 Tax=Elysia marginata TaxID=1093978 RepID=A0AAV4FRL3_9GAST|nr:pre-mRNA-processing factor 17-like [Elysia marginata]